MYGLWFLDWGLRALLLVFRWLWLDRRVGLGSVRLEFSLQP